MGCQMSDKLRRTKDIVSRKINTYLKATTQDYIDLMGRQSPTYITYFQINTAMSTQDEGLETINSLVGPNSPNVYKRIYDLPVYGVDALSISNQLNERGLQTSIDGEFIIPPNSIRPYPGDLFVFDYEGLENHVFVVNDVQFDRASPEKYFKCQFNISPYELDKIQQQVSDDYVLNEDGKTNSNDGNIIKQTDAITKENSEKLVDSLIDRYVKLFYDADTDSFLLKGKDGINYWCPYLQHFLHETKALSKLNPEFMTEIYIGDINEIDFPKYYKEETYRKSLFWNLETKDMETTISNNFLTIEDVNLKGTRNLPYFCSDTEFKSIAPITLEDDETLNVLSYLNARPILFPNEKKFSEIDHFHKLHKMDALHQARILNIEEVKDGDIVYECLNNELVPTGIFKFENKKFIDVSINAIINGNYNTTNLLLNIVSKYLGSSLTLTDDINKELDKYYFKQDITTYILLPMVIYAIKESL